jgi:hypothetical protein
MSAQNVCQLKSPCDDSNSHPQGLSKNHTPNGRARVLPILKASRFTPIDFATIKATVDYRQVVEQELGVTLKNGRCPCPFHNGTDNNFSVTATHAKCFSKGCFSGDVFNFIRKVRTCSHREAAEILSGSLPGSPTRPAGRRTRTKGEKGHPTFQDALAAAEDSPWGKSDWTLGAPRSIHAYAWPNGEIKAYVARYERSGPDGEREKTIRPFSLHGTVWLMKDPPEPWPLYELHRILDAVAAGQRVLIVEGEKCADIANTLGVVATTSAHGSKCAKGTDWSPLAGALAVINPDVGESGEGYFQDVAKHLTKLDQPATVQVLRFDELTEDGDDIEQWLERLPNHADPDPKYAGETLARLMDDAPAWAPDRESDDDGFDLDLMPLREYMQEQKPPKFLVEGLLAEGDLLAVAGQLKTLKTSISLDMAVSIGMGVPFLGRFPVWQPHPVGFLSGETGRYMLQQNIKQICIERGAEYRDNETIFISSTLPTLSNLAHQTTLRKAICDRGLKVLIIDPLYLCIPAGSNGINVANMFEIGPILKDFADLCRDEGCVPAFNHHFPKTRVEQYAPPELHELAYGGTSLVMGQWVLLSRRERFDPNTGVHKLHMVYGGRAGHSGELALDINTGVVTSDFKARRWEVAVSTSAEYRAAQAEAKRQKATERDEAKIIEEQEAMAAAVIRFRHAPDYRLTKRALRTATGWRDDRAERILFRLVEDGFIRREAYRAIIGSKTSREVEGYVLIETHRGMK